MGIPTTGLYGTLATSGWLHSIFARRALRSPSAALTGAMVCADTCAKYAFWCSCESWLTSVLFFSRNESILSSSAWFCMASSLLMMALVLAVPASRNASVFWLAVFTSAFVWLHTDSWFS